MGDSFYTLQLQQLQPMLMSRDDQERISLKVMPRKSALGKYQPQWKVEAGARCRPDPIPPSEVSLANTKDEQPGSLGSLRRAQATQGT